MFSPSPLLPPTQEQDDTYKPSSPSRSLQSAGGESSCESGRPSSSSNATSDDSSAGLPSKSPPLSMEEMNALALDAEVNSQSRDESRYVRRSYADSTGSLDHMCGLCTSSFDAMGEVPLMPRMDPSSARRSGSAMAAAMAMSSQQTFYEPTPPQQQRYHRNKIIAHEEEYQDLDRPLHLGGACGLNDSSVFSNTYRRREDKVRKSTKAPTALMIMRRNGSSTHDQRKEVTALQGSRRKTRSSSVAETSTRNSEKRHEQQQRRLSYSSSNGRRPRGISEASGNTALSSTSSLSSLTQPSQRMSAAPTALMIMRRSDEDIKSSPSFGGISGTFGGLAAALPPTREGRGETTASDDPQLNFEQQQRSTVGPECHSIDGSYGFFPPDTYDSDIRTQSFAINPNEEAPGGRSEFYHNRHTPPNHQDGQSPPTEMTRSQLYRELEQECPPFVLQDRPSRTSSFPSLSSQAVGYPYVHQGTVDNNINVDPGCGRAYVGRDVELDHLWWEGDHTANKGGGRIPLAELTLHHPSYGNIPAYRSLNSAHPMKEHCRHISDSGNGNLLKRDNDTSFNEVARTADQEDASGGHKNVPPSLPHNPKQNKNKCVRFESTQIRTYETILGDNPSCSDGPSLSLGWSYDPFHLQITVDDYERHQAQLSGGLKTRPEDLVLSRDERESILLRGVGYTKSDLAEAVRHAKKVKNRRHTTLNNLPVTFVEERWEVFCKALRRVVLRKECRRTNHLYEAWRQNSASSSDSSVMVKSSLKKKPENAYNAVPLVLSS